MESFTLTLTPEEGWRLLGSTPEKAPVEAVLRSFDGRVEFATGSSRSAPDGAPVVVTAGGGARLSGLHFFARAAGGAGPRRILVRGV
ncbi:MAG: hypothetical protein IT460_02545 [Planctomycetes bacterium]|nr:hypothetical protein [Planctomycetota bacterium]